MTPPTSMRRESPQPSEPVASSAHMADISPSYSDGEEGEKPVREKLRDATIGGQATEDAGSGLARAKAISSNGGEGRVTEDDRGRLRRKRSFEDVERGEGGAESLESNRHVRKRSREAISGSDIPVTAAPSQTTSTALNGSRTGRAGTPDTSSDPMDDEELQNAGLTSPKNKRTRDQVLRDEEASANSVEAAPVAVKAVIQEEQKLGSEKTDSDEEPRTKRSRDSGSPQAAGQAGNAAPLEGDALAAKIVPSSGFANPSAASPFATSASKSPPLQTSASAFAASGFGSFAKSASPFGAAPTGAKSPFGGSGAPAASGSVFGSKASGTGFGGLTETASTFGASSTSKESTSSSTFGSAFNAKPSVTSTSGFGSLGGGFGGGFGSAAGGSKLSSFAGGSGPKIAGLSNKPAAAFGAATADDSDDENGDGSDADESGIKSPINEEVKKDKRFYEQSVETGEENETTVFLQRAKLYSFSATAPSTEKKWIERGVGNLKLNIDKAPPPDAETAESQTAKTKARFVMRAEGSHKVILNSPVQKGSKCGEQTGERPKGQKFYFLGRPEGSEGLETMILKLKTENAQQLWDQVHDLQEEI